MKNNKIIFISTAVILVFAFIGATVFYRNQEKNRLGFLASENSEIFIRDYSPTLGSDDAKVYLIEFLDPECEACREFYPVVKRLLKKYEGKVKLVVRYAPFHSNSQFVIKILEASRKQGKYWETLELLFKYQPNWGSHHAPNPDLIFEYLPEIGVDTKQILDHIADEDTENIINQDFLDGKELGVRRTPTFFVNGKRLERFGEQYLDELIESELGSNY